MAFFCFLLLSCDDGLLLAWTKVALQYRNGCVLLLTAVLLLVRVTWQHYGIPSGQQDKTVAGHLGCSAPVLLCFPILFCLLVPKQTMAPDRSKSSGVQSVPICEGIWLSCKQSIVECEQPPLHLNSSALLSGPIFGRKL